VRTDNFNRPGHRVGTSSGTVIALPLQGTCAVGHTYVYASVELDGVRVTSSHLALASGGLVVQRALRPQWTKLGTMQGRTVGADVLGPRPDRPGEAGDGAAGRLAAMLR